SLCICHIRLFCIFLRAADGYVFAGAADGGFVGGGGLLSGFLLQLGGFDVVVLDVGLEVFVQSCLNLLGIAWSQFAGFADQLDGFVAFVIGDTDVDFLAGFLDVWFLLIVVSDHIGDAAADRFL